MNAFVFALAWRSFGVVAPEPSAVVLPPSVSGLPDETAARVRGVVVAGMERDDLEIHTVEPPAGSGRCDEPDCVRDVLARGGWTWAIDASIFGANRIYEVHLAARGRDGRTVARVDERCDVCGTVDVERMLAEAAARLARALAAGDGPSIGPGIAPRLPLAAASATGADVGKRARHRRPLRIAGAVTTGVGAAGLVGGITLLAIDERPYQRDCDPDASGRCRMRYDTSTGGAVLTAIGSALVATGVALLVTSRREHRARRR